jgi:hypothetical protein
MDGDVIPGRDGELFAVERWTDVAVRAGEDDESLATGKSLPMRIRFGEMTFEDTVGTFVFDDEREMRGVVRGRADSVIERAEEDRK